MMCNVNPSKTRVQEVVDGLQSAIRAGTYTVGALLPTERELQARYSVSRSTIRRALSQLVECGWADSQANRGVSAKIGSPTSGSRLIAFVDYANDVHKTLFFYLGQLLDQKGYHLVHVDSTHRQTIGALESAAEKGFAGAVYWGKETFMPADRYQAVREKMALIAVDHRPANVSVDCVMGDHFEGARRMAMHLADLGHRSIAVSGFNTLLDDANQRLLGFCSGLFERNLEVEGRNLVFSSPSFQDLENTELLRYRLLQADRPDAVFVLHDISVPVIAATVLDCGFRIPEDVAVVGFGNDLPFTVEDFGLTTIAIDWHKVAELLVDRIVFRLSQPHAPVEKLIAPTRLVVRGSCGAPRETWSNEEYQVSSATLTRRMPLSVWREEFASTFRPPIPSSLSVNDRLDSNASPSEAVEPPVPLSSRA